MTCNKVNIGKISLLSESHSNPQFQLYHFKVWKKPFWLKNMFTVFTPNCFSTFLHNEKIPALSLATYFWKKCDWITKSFCYVSGPVCLSALSAVLNAPSAQVQENYYFRLIYSYNKSYWVQKYYFWDSRVPLRLKRVSIRPTTDVKIPNSKRGFS